MFLVLSTMMKFCDQLTAEEPPSPSKDLPMSASRHDPGVFFFLGGIVVLIILLIVVFIFWKRTKWQAKVTENTAPKSQQHGNLRKAS